MTEGSGVENERGREDSAAQTMKYTTLKGREVAAGYEASAD